MIYEMVGANDLAKHSKIQHDIYSPAADGQIATKNKSISYSLLINLLQVKIIINKTNRNGFLKYFTPASSSGFC